MSRSASSHVRPVRPWLWLTAAATAVVGGGTGFWAGRWQTAEKEDGASVQRERMVSAAESDSGLPAGKGPSAPLSPAARALESWVARLEAADAGTLPELSRDVARVFDEPDAGKLPPIEPLVSLLAARWVEVDPAAAAALGTTITESKAFCALFYQELFAEWALRDPAAALAALSTLPPLDHPPTAESIGSALLSGETPEAFWAWFQLAREPLPGGGQAWLGMARRFPAEMEALVPEVSEKQGGSVARDFLKILAIARAETDQQAALARAREQPESVRNAALQGVLAVIARQHPEEALKHLSLLQVRPTGPNSYEGSGADDIERHIYRQLVSRDPKQALAVLKADAHEPGRDMIAVDEIGRQLARAIESGALSAQEAIRGLAWENGDHDSVAKGVLSSLWRGVSAETLAETSRWIVTTEVEFDKPGALRSLAAEWMTTDPAGAMAFVGTLEDQAMRRHVYDGIVSHSRIGRVDQAAERWVAAVGHVPAEERAWAIANYFETNRFPSSVQDGYNEPFGGTTYATAFADLPPSAERDQAAGRFAAIWGERDPASAMQWAMAWPASEAGETTRAAAVSSVMQGWVNADAFGASAWAAQLEPGPDRDAAARQIARAVSATEPDSAWAWAGSIADPAARAEAQAGVLRHWRDRDPVAAREAVEAAAASLDAAGRTRLLDTLNRRD